jgi:hypothetical protein
MIADVAKDKYLTLLRSGNFSDFIIERDDVTLKVYKNIIGATSPMLDTACNGPFEVNSFWQRSSG